MISGLIRTVIVTLGLLGTLCVPIYAHAESSSVDTSLPPVTIPDSPLYITAYSTQILQSSETSTTLASQLRYVEIYNTSSDPVDMQNWQLKISWFSKSGNVSVVTKTHSLTLNTGEKTYLPPNNYAVISFNGAVNGASYSTELEDVETGQFIGAIELTHENYNPYHVAIDDILLANKSDQSVPMRLGQTTTGYTSTGKYKSDERSTLYDNGLYIPRDNFSALPVEIVANSRNCSPQEAAIECGDYVKFYNATSQPIDFSGTRLRIGYQGQSVNKSNAIELSGVAQPGSYVTFTKDTAGNNLSVTNLGGYVWLEDTYGITTYKNTITEYPDASSTTHKGQSWALNDDNEWAWTVPNPLGPNIFLPPEIKQTTTTSDTRVPCRADQYRSEETGRCRNIASTSSTLKECQDNQYRSVETNRCRNIATTSTASLTPCKPGQMRNPETNRCRAIASTATAQLQPCVEGKVRNPETNRCRNADAAVLGDAAGFAVEKTEAAGNSAGLWVLGGIGILALGRGIWEWRFELLGVVRRALGVFKVR